MSRRILFLIGVAGLVSSPGLAWGQRAVFLVRHAEKAADSGDPGLTPAGTERARELAERLHNAGIQAIFTSDARRTRDTARPLAEALGLEPIVIPQGDPETTFQRIRSQHADQVILVVGHSNTIPMMVTRWKPSFEGQIAETEFDKVFLVMPAKDGDAGIAELRYGTPSVADGP